MNRKEIYEIFECREAADTEPIGRDEAEYIRISYIMNNPGSDILSSIVSKYRSSYSEEALGFLVETIAMVVNDPKLTGTPISPFVLTPLIVDSLGDRYFDVVSCLERLSEVEGTARRVFVPMIYGLSLKCSRLQAGANIGAYVSGLEVLTGFPSVLEELKDEVYWGVCEEAGTIKSKLSFNFPTYSGFSCKFPCFLDGFFEPFVYEKCGSTAPAKEYVGVPMQKVREMSRTAYRSLSDHSYKMHKALLPIISNSRELRTNFMRYVGRVIANSRERNKTVFDWRECISDGFAYNMSALMSRFNKRIVDGNMVDKINPENVEDISTVSFPTFCYFAKVHLLFTSCVKFGEYIRSLSYEYTYMNMEGGERMETYRKGIDSKINSLNGLLFTTELFADEEPFTSFMADYTAEVEYPWPDFYYQTLLWMQRATIDLNPSMAISSSMNKVMEDIMDWRTPMFKKEVVRILYHRSSSVKFTMINRVVDYYNSLERDQVRMEARNIIHAMFREGRVFSRMNVCKRNITFINCMMKDFEYSLSEGLSAIKDIKEDQKTVEELEEELRTARKEMEDARRGGVSRDVEDRDLDPMLQNMSLYTALEKKIENISERIGSLKKSVSISRNKANNSFHYVEGCFDLFMHILEEKPDLFLVEEMISNFVRVLNCNLKVIIGPRCADLVIKSPKQYGFDPRGLLRRIIMIYITIHSDRFVEMVASDKMYFDIGFFRRALEICEGKYLINESQVSELRRLIERLEGVVVVEGDEPIPEEFVDPLTCNPIQNPVRLLTSRITVDRSTYDMLMMNGGIDPFNRMPLTEDMVVEDGELKRKIDDYYSSRRGGGLNPSAG